MLRLSNSNEVWWRIDVPDRDDNGERVERPVRFRLRIYTRAELKAKATERAQAATTAMADAMRRLVGAKTREDVAAASADLDAAADRMVADDTAETEELRARIVGWNAEDVTDDNGPVEFSAYLRDQLLADEARYAALRDGLMQASRGARPKNSSPGPAGSPAAAQGGGTNSYGATDRAH